MRILHGAGFILRILLFFVLSCLGLSLINVRIVFAERSVGVSLGQFLRYSSDVGVTGNDTELVNLSEWSYEGFSEWHGFCSIMVDYVNHSQIGFIDDDYNASWSNSVFRSEDVATGRGLEDYVMGYEPFFVAANLTVGDDVVSPLAGGFPIQINDTILTNYLGSPRETNRIIIERNGLHTTIQNVTTINDVEVSCNHTYHYFFDKLTGIPVRLVFDIQYYRGNETDLLVTNVRAEYDLLSLDPTIPEFAPSVFLMFFAQRVFGGCSL